MKKILTLAVFFIVGHSAIAQTADSLLNSMSKDNTNRPVAIFKSSRFILSQTTETVKKKNLNFLVIHRFGDFAGANGGGKLYYGLDDVADVYLGFEYGLTDNLNIDIGRATIGGLADLELKYAVLHQTSDGSSPIAITLLGETGLRPYSTYTTLNDRLSYFGQVLIAHQFTPRIALQIAPSYVMDNTPIPLVVGVERNFFALSATARIKVSKHMGFIVDYAHPFSSFRTRANGFVDPLAFGIEIETGGHVFTMNISNARAISEINYLSNTQSRYSKGEYRIGFTISRIFDFNHKDETKK
ncbi:MAG: DUF5777 family beta-barrel protein [Mucilaginibacter sp.]